MAIFTSDFWLIRGKIGQKKKLGIARKFHKLICSFQRPWLWGLRGPLYHRRWYAVKPTLYEAL